MASGGTPQNGASAYLFMSFYSQCRLIVNTNSTGEVRELALQSITKILGPFALIAKPHLPHSLAHIFYSEREPFGTKCGTEKRISLQVQLCALFGELYRRGWRTTSICPVMDCQKRRGTIVFKFHPALVSSTASHEFAAMNVNEYSHLNTAIPRWAESRVFREIRSTERSRDISLGKAVSRKEWKLSTSRHLVAERIPISRPAVAAPTEASVLQAKMRFILDLIRAMHTSGFCLVGSFSVFGDQQDILMFSHQFNQGDYETEALPHEAPSFAMTVMKPRMLVLANAAPDVHELIRRQVNEDVTWKVSRGQQASEWWSRRLGSFGKVAYARVLRRLALAGYFPMASYDGLYKNSFVLFSHDPGQLSSLHAADPISSNPRPESYPRVLSFTLISDKKLKVDDAYTTMLDSAGSVAERDTRTCLAGMDRMLTGTRKSSTDETMRIFSSETFSSNSVETMAKELCIFLVITIQMELMGYKPLATGNLSGRYDRPEHDNARMVSPHTWFFMNLGPLATNEDEFQRLGLPSFESAEAVGLPTYEEAMRLGGWEDHVDGTGDGKANESGDDDVGVENGGSDSP